MWGSLHCWLFCCLPQQQQWQHICESQSPASQRADCFISELKWKLSRVTLCTLNLREKEKTITAQQRVDILLRESEKQSANLTKLLFFFKARSHTEWIESRKERSSNNKSINQSVKEEETNQLGFQRLILQLCYLYYHCSEPLSGNTKVWM